MRYKKAGPTIEDLGEHCTLQQAADYADVHRTTVQRWIARGLLKASRPIKRGSSRVRVDTASLRELVDPYLT